MVDPSDTNTARQAALAELASPRTTRPPSPPCRPEHLAGRSGKQADGTDLTREAKLGSVFTQTAIGSDGEPLCDPGSTTCTGTMGACRASGDLLPAEALGRGLGLAELVVFIGSGVVEAGCKSVVGRRLKRSGMLRGVSGAENILRMLCIIKGRHFDAAWQARRPLLAARQSMARRWKSAA